jgi:hypothetical protein
MAASDTNAHAVISKRNFMIRCFFGDHGRTNDNAQFTFGASVLVDEMTFVHGFGL